jgi:hypothetical protein
MDSNRLGAPAVALHSTAMIVNSAIRLGLGAALLGMLLFGISAGVLQFSRNDAVLRQARVVSGWSFVLAMAALAGSLVANQFL